MVNVFLFGVKDLSTFEMTVTLKSNLYPRNIDLNFSHWALCEEPWPEPIRTYCSLELLGLTQAIFKSNTHLSHPGLRKYIFPFFMLKN